MRDRLLTGCRSAIQAPVMAHTEIDEERRSRCYVLLYMLNKKKIGPVLIANRINNGALIR